ncbi:MAG: aminopeptidase [Stenotrophobium sp.]
MPVPLHTALMRAAALGAALLLGGCGNLGYYAHLAGGEYHLLSKREAIAEILKNPKTDPVLKARLAKVLDARAYASQTLHLPDNRSYTLYADVGRPFVVWNVFAAPELSLQPVQQCFLLVGCLAYRGYFDVDDARAEAARLKAEGNDVFVAGIPAYSTLGWFNDPVINTMMRWSDEQLIATVFHELAHQEYYLNGDTAFDESFANFVGEEGLRQYLAARGGASDAEMLRREREQIFVKLLMDTRERLDAIYSDDIPDSEKRARKQAEFQRLRDEYTQLREGPWKDFPAYDGWFAGAMNNAKLLPFGLYNRWVPAFAELYRQQGNDWIAFYKAVKKLGELPDEERERRLTELLATAKPSQERR